MVYQYPPTILTFSEKHFQRKKGKMMDANGNIVFIFYKSSSSSTEVFIKTPQGLEIGSFRPSELRSKKVVENGKSYEAGKYLDKKTGEFSTPCGRKLRWIGASVCVDESYNCIAIYDRRPKRGGPTLVVHEAGIEVLGSITLSLMVLEQRLEDNSDGEIADSVSEVMGTIVGG